MIDHSAKSGLHGSEAREWWRLQRLRDLRDICHQLDLEVRELTPYQIRVAGKIDFFPTNGKYHVLTPNHRGDFHTYQDIKALLERYAA